MCVYVCMGGKWGKVRGGGPGPLPAFRPYLNVTVYGKTRHMEFSVKIKFDASLISSTLELTHLQV